MDYWFFWAATAVLFVAFFIREGVAAKRREKRFIESLYRDYGKLPGKEYSPERYVRIASYYQKHIAEGMIDDITWNDLNMDDIFKQMNYTFSASGEEYLYYTLRNIGRSKKELDHFEDVVRFFMEHGDERVKVQVLMSKLGYTGKYSLYDYIDNLDYLGERSNRKHIICNLLLLLSLGIAPFYAEIALFGVIAVLTYNIITYFKEKCEIEPYIISFAYVMRLMQAGEKLLKIPVPVCGEEWAAMKASNSALQSMKRGSSLVLSSTQGTGSGNPLDIIMDYIKMIFHVDLMQFNKMLSKLRRHIKDVDTLITCVGYVESAIAIGALRQSLDEYCVPVFGENKELSITDAYHILIENPVKNSISTDRGVLLTGSNASGKSTFLKTIALNAIFAQTIHTCTASQYKAPFFTIYSSMSLRDSIDSGESYYIVEIKALKRILDGVKESNRTVLCFVDEVLRGTNTVERIAASTQILKSLAGSGILCFAATHDIEMTELLKLYYKNYHFEEDIRDGDVFFNYKLMSGKATTRNAIKLLEIMGYDMSIIEKASKQAQHFVDTGAWELLDV